MWGAFWFNYAMGNVGKSCDYSRGTNSIDLISSYGRLSLRFFNKASSQNDVFSTWLWTWTADGASMNADWHKRFNNVRFVRTTTLSKKTQVHRTRHNDVKITVEIWYLSREKLFMLSEREKRCNRWRALLMLLHFLSALNFHRHTTLKSDWHYLHTKWH